VTDDAREQLRRAEIARLAGERARRAAVQGRIIRTGVMVAAVLLLSGVLDTWVTARWLWWLSFSVGFYLILRATAFVEERLPVRAGRTPRADLVVGAVSLAAVAALYPVLPHGFAAYLISAAVVLAVAMAGAWWFAR
jgi:cation transport ATPase